LRRLADWPANDRGSASGDTIAVSLHSIDPLLQGRSPKGDSARHFVRATTGLVRAVPVSCAPCPFRHFVFFFLLTVVWGLALLCVQRAVSGGVVPKDAAPEPHAPARPLCLCHHLPVPQSFRGGLP
jgi:hypothetical protein